MDLLFLGAAGTVTGSKFLLEAGGHRVLVDCGLFQGYKHLRLRNRAPLPIDPASVAAALLTHAHLDHSGYLPLFVRDGFTGTVHCTAGTAGLCELLLPDSGRIQEEEAEHANRRGFSKHRPALPLYTEADALACLARLRPVELDTPVGLGGGFAARLLQAGHVLGAAMVEVLHGDTTVLFSGDLGRPDDPVMEPPHAAWGADVLVLESTYGNRRHPPTSAAEAIRDVVARTMGRGGVLLVPAFAVGRTQVLLHLLRGLKDRGEIPDVPVFVNSPMARDATRLFLEHHADHALTRAETEAACKVATYVNSVAESKALNERRGPMIIISASGMAAGGRILHHLKTFAPDPGNAILFTGFQAGGTRGRDLVEGARSIRIHGEDVPVRAEVHCLDSLSAHADQDQVLAWLAGAVRRPRQVYLVHGEPEASDALRRRIQNELGWNVHVAEHLAKVKID